MPAAAAAGSLACVMPWGECANDEDATDPAGPALPLAA
jgi:hypothetical protein